MKMDRDTPEDYAFTLVEMFFFTDNVPDEVTAKNCALLCVDVLIEYCEIIKHEDVKYWNEVKTEIEKLKYEPTRP